MPANNRIHNDGSELVPYNDPRFPIYCSEILTRERRGLWVQMHWHDELEFLYAKKGGLLNVVNGREIRIDEGQLIFVNSGILHTQKFAESDCDLVCLLLHPSLFGVNEETVRDFILPVQKSLPSYMVLDRSVPGGNSLIDGMLEISRLISEGFDLHFPQIMSQAWNMLSELYLLMKEEKDLRDAPDPRAHALHEMIGFIQQHYAESVSLTEIADAGNVSRSSCNLIFRTLAGQTPFEFLTRYRLNKVEKRLHGSGSVAEIAAECGFASQSYLAETFKKYNHQTISEYRKSLPR